MGSSEKFYKKGVSMNYMEYSQENSISNFMYRVYGWMTLGLCVTAAIAYYVASTPSLAMSILTKPILFYGLFIVQIGIVLALSFLINRMSFAMAFGCFLLYAATLGLTLSSIFLVYQINSIYVTFLVTSLTFGIMCLYGYFTKADLTTIGSISMMALIGIIIASLVNMFLKNQTMDYIISGIGVVIFTLLTAYDSQKIKHMAQSLLLDKETMSKIALLGALTLYLDFINLFLFLLRFLGKPKDQ